MSKPKAHVSNEKKKVVQQLKQMMTSYPIVGIVNMENLPAQQLQIMKRKLRGKIELFMAKKRLMKIAIEQCKDKQPGIEALADKMVGMPALLCTKENPFLLFKILKQNKSKAPAKAGQTAPADIIVSAGKTNFLPGPIIGELGSIGIKSKVDGGKIAIIADTVVVKEGEIIKPNVASMLLRLGVNPMEIGLDLVAVYEAGIIYDRKILDVDDKQYIANITTAAGWAFNLAIEAGYTTRETTEFLIAKGQREAKAVALEAAFLTSDTVEEILAKASRVAEHLNQITGG